MAKHSGKTVEIEGVEFYLAGIIVDGRLVGYVLQPTDEFSNPKLTPQTGKQDK